MANMIGVSALLASVGFNDEMQAMLNAGHGHIEIEINESGIGFSFTNFEIGVSDEKHLKHKRNIEAGGIGKLVVVKAGRHIKTGVTRSRYIPHR